MVEISSDPLGFQTTPPRSKPEICLIGLLDLFLIQLRNEITLCSWNEKAME